MPKRYRKRRRRRARRSKKAYKVSTSKLADSRINTLVERRIKTISKQEIAKALPSNLIHRRYWFCDYDSHTNLFVNPTNIDRAGIVVSLVQVPVLDIATQPVAQANPLVLDPNLRPNPTYFYGQNVLMPQRGHDGYRRGSEIQLKNMQILIKTWVDKLTAQALLQPRFEKVTLIWHVVAVNQLHNIQSVPGHTPAYESLIRIPTWGYTNRLDKTSEDERQGFSVKVLMKGATTFAFSSEVRKEATYDKYIKFGSKGIKMEYEPGDPANLAPSDIYGQEVVSSRKIYFCVRSDMDPGVPADYKPRFAMCCKLGYTDT